MKQPADLNGWTVDVPGKQVINKTTKLHLNLERMKVVGKWLLQVAAWFDREEKNPAGLHSRQGKGTA